MENLNADEAGRMREVEKTEFDVEERTRVRKREREKGGGRGRRKEGRTLYFHEEKYKE